MTSIALRPVDHDDLKTLTDMALAFHIEDGHPLSDAGRAALKHLCDGDLQTATLACCWLIESAGVPVGYVVLTLGFSVEYGGPDGFIDDLYLVPDARGQGIGTAIMAQVETEARTRGIQALHLEVETNNARAQTLYAARGYNPSGRLLMSKRL